MEMLSWGNRMYFLRIIYMGIAWVAAMSSVPIWLSFFYFSSSKHWKELMLRWVCKFHFFQQNPFYVASDKVSRDLEGFCCCLFVGFLLVLKVGISGPAFERFHTVLSLLHVSFCCCLTLWIYFYSRLLCQGQIRPHSRGRNLLVLFLTLLEVVCNHLCSSSSWKVVTEEIRFKCPK